VVVDPQVVVAQNGVAPVATVSEAVLVPKKEWISHFSTSRLEKIALVFKIRKAWPIMRAGQRKPLI
jgi:hypothetical protein